MQLVQQPIVKKVIPLEMVRFVHINKTGGTSIENALGRSSSHKIALIQREEIGDVRWAESYSFSFVRNPWDKVVSQYFFKIRNNDPSLVDNLIPFDQWVEEVWIHRNPIYASRVKSFMPQHDWLSDEHGEIMVDFVGRFENINADFDKICQAIGHDLKLPHLNKTAHKPYREVYNAKSRSIIERAFQRDIDYFGYTF